MDALTNAFMDDKIPAVYYPASNGNDVENAFIDASKQITGTPIGSILNKQEWLALRKIGSSDVAAILGVNPYRSAHRVFLEKVGAFPAFEGNQTTKWGQRLEAVIADAFSEETGLPIEKCDYIYSHPTHPENTSTPDYFCLENGKLGCVEIKNTSDHMRSTWEDGIPDSAHVQLMHQLYVTGLSFGYVVGLVGGNKLFFHRVERDAALIETIENEVMRFWCRIETKTPPPLAASDGDILKAMFPQATAEEVTLGEHALPYIIDYSAACERLKAAEETKSAAQNNLCAMLGNHAKAKYGDYTLSWSNRARTSLDSKRLQQEAPEIFERFQTSTSYRVFNLKKQGEKTNGKK